MIYGAERRSCCDCRWRPAREVPPANAGGALFLPLLVKDDAALSHLCPAARYGTLCVMRSSLRRTYNRVKNVALASFLSCRLAPFARAHHIARAVSGERCSPRIVRPAAGHAPAGMSFIFFFSLYLRGTAMRKCLPRARCHVTPRLLSEAR